MDVVGRTGCVYAQIPVSSTYTISAKDVEIVDAGCQCIKEYAATYGSNTKQCTCLDKNSIPELPKYEPSKKENDTMERVTIPMPTKILRNGRATVVFFADDTKVVVKLPEGVEDSDYNAFCAAITKKMFGTNARIKSKIEKITEAVPTDEEKKEAAKKAKEEAKAKQQAEIDKKVCRMAHEMVLEKRAEQLAKEMMGNV